MSDLITLVGTIVDHEGATPLEGARITATPSQRVTQTSDGEEALSDASATTDETGAFTLPLVYAEGLRYTIVYRSGGERLMRGVLDCDSYAAGATVDVADLPPIAGIPPSAVETLQAWFLAQLEALGEGGAVVSVNGQGGIVVLDAAAVGALPDTYAPTWGDITGKPSNFPPSTHSHVIGDTTGLQAALDAKAATTHTHAPSDVTGTAVITTDARLSDARTPTAHATSHASGGSDPVTPASIGAATPAQVTDGDSATLAAAQSHAQGLVDALTSASPATLDTLAEIAAALGEDPNFAATMTAALANRVRFDAAQSLTVPQQAQARTNIGAGTSSFSGAYGDLDNKPTLGDSAGLDVGTTAGTVAAGDHAHSTYAPLSGQFPVNTVAASGATETLPATHAAHRVTMDQNCEFTFSAPAAGHAFLLHLSGAFTPTWPASVDWAGGSAPTYAAAGTLYHFVTFDAGATWLGSGQAYS